MLPVVGGISAGLLSWATGGSSYLTGAAIAGVLGGVGWMLTRMIFQIESLTEEAMQAQLDAALRTENEELDELARKLRTDRDHRTQDYLTLLRSLRADFEEASHTPGKKIRSAQVREQVGQVFRAAVSQLQQSYKLWELSENLVGDTRNKILEDREQVIGEIETTIDRMNEAIKQFKSLMQTDGNIDLAKMRDELDATMKIAKRTEERMRDIEQPQTNYDIKEFE